MEASIAKCGSDTRNCFCWGLIRLYTHRPHFKEPRILCQCWYYCRAGKVSHFIWVYVILNSKEGFGLVCQWNDVLSCATLIKVTICFFFLIIEKLVDFLKFLSLPWLILCQTFCTLVWWCSKVNCWKNLQLFIKRNTEKEKKWNHNNVKIVLSSQHWFIVKGLQGAWDNS